MTNEQLAKHPATAWAFRLAELDGFPGEALVAVAYANVYEGRQWLPEAKRTPEAIQAAQEETAQMQKRAAELTAELDAARLLDWSLCHAK